MTLATKPLFLSFNRKVYALSFIFIFAISLWLLPIPFGLTAKGIHLFALFMATIVSIIIKVLPIGTIAILSLTVAMLTHTLSMEEALSGFSHDIVWLVVVSFFIAKGFIKTGLGARIAHLSLQLMGKSTLGLSYGMVLADLILAPAIPSVTARTGGILFPILSSLCKSLGSEPFTPSHRKIGAFLITMIFQSSVITSAMFVTSMAANPFITRLAGEAGIFISWGKWAIAALLPGLLSLLITPYLIYLLYPPEIRYHPYAKDFAKRKLQEQGKMRRKEWLMLLCFLSLLVLWIFGSSFGVTASQTAFIGVSFLLVSGVLEWQDIIEEKTAWDTFIWFGVLVTLSSYLNKLGLTYWFSQAIVGSISGYSWVVGFGCLSLLYFYSHYFFASSVAHVGAMYTPFLLVSLAIGTPPMLAAFILAFFSSLFGGLTHYGSGPAPLLFGSGYVPIGWWWKIGGIISIVNILLWGIIGVFWWKILGLF